jgi:hypothetical protein
MPHARPVTRVGQVGFGVFSYNFRVGSGYFLSLCENRPTPDPSHCRVGQVGFIRLGSP